VSQLGGDSVVHDSSSGAEDHFGLIFDEYD